MMKKLLSLFIGVLYCTILLAQKEAFHFYAKLDSVKESGFYNIPIIPALTPYIETDLRDIRIADEKDLWIPHIIFQETDIARHYGIIECNILSINNNSNLTTVIVENKADLINNIGLSVKNNTVERFCSLSGSDDQKTWFIISDSILLKTPVVETSGKSLLTLDFPPQNYRYLKLEVSNKNSYPLNILSAQYEELLYSPLFPINNPFKNSSSIIQQKDSAKLSIIKVTLDKAYQLDEIKINTKGIKYFSRNIDLCIAANNNYGPPVTSFLLSNNSTLQFHIPLIKTKEFYLIIHNNDNPPLTITEVNTFIGFRSLKTYLEAGKKYSLLLDGDVAFPVYDLTMLKDSIPKITRVLNAAEIIPLNTSSTISNAKKYHEKWIIWAVLIFALIILTVLAIRMVRQISNKKSDDNI